MNNHKWKIILGIILLIIGFFVLDDYLCEQKATYPIEAERVVRVFVYDVGEGHDNIVVSDEDAKAIIAAINSLNPVHDEALQEKVAKEQKPWFGEKTLYHIYFDYDSTFWKRTPAADLYLYEDGHMMMNCVAPYRPYPHIVDYDAEYTYLRYGIATSGDYDEVLDILYEIRDKYMQGEVNA